MTEPHSGDLIETGDQMLSPRLIHDGEPVTYEQIYRNLDGLTALATAAATPLRRHKDEKDTAFVKRIVATYMKLAHDSGVHDARI